ncbi:MAG: hypothetical protein ACT6Q9_07410 [Polaromonas sp.]|uniref:hypothetical protein n=1 Tax=Polaromonas sp. TaxID=1869339 RepID=UPI0040367CF8
MSNSFAVGSFDHSGDWTPLKAENHGSILLKNRRMSKSVGDPDRHCFCVTARKGGISCAAGRLDMAGTAAS